MTGYVRRFMLLISLVAILIFPMTAFADEIISLSISPVIECDRVVFTVEIAGGMEPYTMLADFGDGEVEMAASLDAGTIEIVHIYPAHGEYAWSIAFEDSNGLTASEEGTITLNGPTVSLGSTPFPPLLTIDGGEAPILFQAEVTGGVEPYTFNWDLDGDGNPESNVTSDTADWTYEHGGEYTASVVVTDHCGFSHSDTLTVLVVDPEESPEDVCHPMAQRIAEGVSSLFPDQAEQLYSCDDIFNIFEGALFGGTLGFGRMWHAYQLAQNIDELTWETILDWQLNQSGWGALTQLNRFADVLEEQGIQDLMDLVMSEDYTLGDVRTAVRAVTHYEADFDDALERIADGANPGELGQFYRLASDLDVEPSELDTYLEEGASLNELRHAASFAERMGTDWELVADAKAEDHSWGEIGQAYRLADDDTSAAEILAIGVQDFRALEREEDQQAREQEQNQRTAERLAEQYEAELGDVMALFNGECEGDWSCVRTALREQEREQQTSDRDVRTAGQIADKYGATVEEVMAIYESTCAWDWPCTRAYFRDLSR